MNDDERQQPKEFSIDEAYALIDRHIEAIAKLRICIDEAVAAREATVAKALTEDAHPLLTQMEQRTLRYYVRTHLTAGEIARALFVSPNTTKTHLKNIYRKLGVTCRQDLADKVKDMEEVS